ncbi:hypothetical protein [Roseibium sp.]
MLPQQSIAFRSAQALMGFQKAGVEIVRMVEMRDVGAGHVVKEFKT